MAIILSFMDAPAHMQLYFSLPSLGRHLFVRVRFCCQLLFSHGLLFAELCFKILTRTYVQDLSEHYKYENELAAEQNKHHQFFEKPSAEYTKYLILKKRRVFLSKI